MQKAGRRLCGRRRKLRTGLLPRARGSCPLYLGIRAVIVKSFARIHRANLINAGIIPLTFKNPEDYDKISQGDKLSLAGIKTAIEQDGKIALTDDTNGNEFELECPCPTVRNR